MGWGGLMRAFRAERRRRMEALDRLRTLVSLALMEYFIRFFVLLKIG
jgi:hypothetical protein